MKRVLVSALVLSLAGCATSEPAAQGAGASAGLVIGADKACDYAAVAKLAGTTAQQSSDGAGHDGHTIEGLRYNGVSASGLSFVLAPAQPPAPTSTKAIRYDTTWVDAAAGSCNIDTQLMIVPYGG